MRLLTRVLLSVVGLFSYGAVLAQVIAVNDSVVVNEDASTFTICQLDNDNPNGESTPLVTLPGSIATGAITSPISSMFLTNDAACTTPVTAGNTNAISVSLVADAFGAYNLAYYGAYDSLGVSFVAGACASVLDLTNSCGSILITVKSVNDVPSFTAGANQSVLEDSGPQAMPGWATLRSLRRHLVPIRGRFRVRFPSNARADLIRHPRCHFGPVAYHHQGAAIQDAPR